MQIGLTSLSISSRAASSSGGPLGFTQPTLSDLAPYAGVSSSGGYVKYTNVPWGPCFGVEPWAEPTLGGAILEPVVTIYMPSIPAPPGGYGLVLRTHANGSDHIIPEGSGSLWTNLVVPAMEAGYVLATLEFRHPVPNVSLGAPDKDVAYGVQFLRSLASALNLNTNRFHNYATSRGNLSLLTSVDVDQADPGNVNFAKRQSSILKSIFGVNTQDSYSTTEFINTKVVVGDRAACLADPAYADDVRWRSARQLILNGSQTLPYLSTVYDMAFLNALPSHTVGQHTKAALDADSNLQVHCPEFGQSLWNAYYARGQGNKYTTCDLVAGGAVTTQDAVPWFSILDAEPGISAKEARIQAIGRRLAAPIFYFNGSTSGAYVSQGTPTPVTTENSTFGVLIDGAWGSANRLNTATPLGSTMVQGNAALRPFLTKVNANTDWGFALDNVDDVFRITLTNTTADVYSYPENDTPITGYSSRASGLVNLGVDKLSNKKIVLVAAAANTTFNSVETKLMHQFAKELDGTG